MIIRLHNMAISNKDLTTTGNCRSQTIWFSHFDLVFIVSTYKCNMFLECHFHVSSLFVKACVIVIIIMIFSNSSLMSQVSNF